MGAEVTLLRGVIVGVDEDCIVRAGGHARLAADTDRLVEIDNTVRAFKHRAGWAGGDAGRVGALIATRYLMRAAGLREDADVDMLHVGARHRKRYQIFRLAGGGAGVTTNTPGLVDDFGPLHRTALWFFKHVVGSNCVPPLWRAAISFGFWRERTISRNRAKKT